MESIPPIAEAQSYPVYIEAKVHMAQTIRSIPPSQCIDDTERQQYVLCLPEHVRPKLSYRKKDVSKGIVQIELVSPMDPMTSTVLGRPLMQGDTPLYGLMPMDHTAMVMRQLSASEYLSVMTTAFARRYWNLYRRYTHAIHGNTNEDPLNLQKRMYGLEDDFANAMQHTQRRTA